MPRAAKVSTCLFFAGQAEAAVRAYVALIPGSRILAVHRYGPGAPLPEGSVMTISFELAGTPCLAINGPPVFQFTEAMSLVLTCADQAELDRCWQVLLEDGGQAQACGWLKDRFGVSWQVVPARLEELLQSGDAAANARLMTALWGQIKLDVAALERAHRGA
jgi:predicted 3-demethylubiquinone-9 3-methyltransferase (glyoxalase superfamily)